MTSTTTFLFDGLRHARGVKRGMLGFAVALAGGLLAAPLEGQTGSVVPALDEPDFLLSVGMILDVPPDSAVVLGARKEHPIRERSLTIEDRLYIPSLVSGRPLGLSDMVQFFRITRSVRDPVTDEPLGRLRVPTGVGRVDSLAGGIARVRVTDAYLPILIGDLVRVVTEADTTRADGTGSTGPVEGYVVAFQQDKAIHPPFDVLFLRPSYPAAFGPGEVVLLHRPGPVVKGLQLPEILIARAVVVRPEGLLPAAVVMESYRSDLKVGDRFRREEPPPP